MKNLSVFIISLIIALLIAEATLVIKNSNMKNYDIEMWKYSKWLKELSEDEKIGHIHKKSSEAVLQSVKIRTNEYGLRGGPISYEKGKKRFLVLGSSITLGWGVSELDTLSNILDKELGANIEVLNAGVGNYNAVRYINNFTKNLIFLNPDKIILQYFVNDAEKLQNRSGNLLLQKSQLAVSIWSLVQKIRSRMNPVSLFDYYRKIYNKKSDGFIEMQKSLDQLMQYSKDKGVEIIFTMTPDIHQLQPYELYFIHDIMKQEALKRGFTYVDLLDGLKSVEDNRELWAMKGDPHPNALGHKLMADQLLLYLK